jgi:hypothetical protein
MMGDQQVFYSDKDHKITMISKQFVKFCIRSLFFDIDRLYLMERNVLFPNLKLVWGENDQCTV